MRTSVTVRNTMPQQTREQLLKYWLLTAAVDHEVSLACFFPRFEWGPLNMKEIPSCDATDYAAGILSLFESGMIKLRSTSPVDDVRSRSGVHGILERYLAFSRENPNSRLSRRLAKRLSDPRYVYQPDLVTEFKLTANGGAAWEETAKPDWARFFDESDNGETGEIISPNLNLLMARLGWFVDLRGDVKPKLDTVTIETHRNHPILYWKRLPTVYRAEFKVTRTESIWPNSLARPGWFDDWWVSSSHWYTEPWDLPDWPS